MRLFKNLNFLGGEWNDVHAGMLLFSSLVMMPLFLQSLLGYTAESAGLVLSGGGLILLFLMPASEGLSSKDARAKFSGFWLARTGHGDVLFHSRICDLDISFRSACILRVMQVFGLGFLFVPINLTSYVGMPTEKSGTVAGLVNFMRNIGSSVGTSVVTTLLARRAQLHQVYLVANVTPGQRSFADSVAALSAHVVASGVNADRAMKEAYALIYRTVVLQATTLAYIDTFLLLAVIAAIMFVLSFALRKNDPRARGRDDRRGRAREAVLDLLHREIAGSAAKRARILLPPSRVGCAASEEELPKNSRGEVIRS